MRAALDHQRAGVVLADHHVQERVVAVWEGGRGLEDTDDRHRLAVDDHLLADRAAVAAEALHPVVVGEHHDRRHFGAVVAVIQRAAEHRRQPHDVEVVAGDETDIDANSVALAPKRVDHRRVLGDAAEALRTSAEVVDLGDGEHDVLAARAVDRVAQVDEPVAVAVRQRLEEHAANDAEDRGIGADAEPQGKHDGDGEAARAGEAAEGVAEVGDDHWSGPSRLCLPIQRTGRGYFDTGRRGRMLACASRRR